MGIKWKGLKENIEALRSSPTVIKEEVDAAKQESLQKVFGRSQDLVPVKTGELKASGRIEDNKIIYGAPWASVVHEDVSASHDNGQAKYVETAVFELKPEIDKAMNAAVERAFKKSVK